MTNLIRSNFQAHPFHLVSPSPWPIFTCVSLLSLTTTGVLTMHGFQNAEEFLNLALFTLIFSMSLWFRDVISEGAYLGNHTLAVQRGLNMGVGLFIVSEALLFLAAALAPASTIENSWFLSSPPKPHSYVSLPLQSSVNLKLINLKFSNLKEKFTWRNIFITLVSLVFAYLLKLSISYLLTLDNNTWHHYLILGFISSTVRPFFKDIFDSVYPVSYCMDASASGSGAGASADLPSESASALAEAEKAGYYNKFHTPESAEIAKNSIKQSMTSDDNMPFEEPYTPVDYLNECRQTAKILSERVSNLSKVKGYFKAIDAGQEPTIEEKIEYDIKKNSCLASFNNKENWFGRKIDFNNPANVKEKSLDDLNIQKWTLSCFLARLEYLEQLDKKYLSSKSNYSKIAESLLEINRKDREANAELIKTITEDSFRNIDLNTKKN